MLDTTFVDAVCRVCPHYRAVGNGVKGGYRVQECWYTRDSLSCKEERRLAKPTHLKDLTVCPDTDRLPKGRKQGD
jgi:hypothetical protein